MITYPAPLVTMLELVDQLPLSAPPSTRSPGRPVVYSDGLFLKALVIMIVRRLSKVHELLSVLEQPTQEMHQLKQKLYEKGRFPSRRTWERRLEQIPDTLPEQIACLGQHLLSKLKPWAHTGRAVAIDSTLLRAKGGVWHKKDREKGLVPHTSIDTDAHWGKSDWHGWIYGWKLHVVLTVDDVWLPLVAELTPANTRRYILGAVFVYQLILWYRFEHRFDLRVGLKAEFRLAHRPPADRAYPTTQAQKGRLINNNLSFSTN